MKFLLDLGVASRVLRTTLLDLGHDVLSARDGYSDASDETLLALACGEDRVLVTQHQNLGEFVFVLRRPHPCIVRLAGLAVAEEAEAMHNLIETHGAAMRERAIIVVTRKYVRIRKADFMEIDEDWRFPVHVRHGPSWPIMSGAVRHLHHPPPGNREDTVGHPLCPAAAVE